MNTTIAPGHSRRRARRNRAAHIASRVSARLVEMTRRTVSAALHKAAAESLASAAAPGMGALVTVKLTHELGPVLLKAAPILKGAHRVGTMYAVTCGGKAWVMTSEQRGAYARHLMAAGITPGEA
jgi:hypothetical protein